MGKNIDSESQASWIGQEVNWWRMECSAKKSLPASFLFGLQGYSRIFARVVEGLGKRTKESSCIWIFGLGSLERLEAGLVESVTHRCQKGKVLLSSS